MKEVGLVDFEALVAVIVFFGKAGW